MTEDQLLKLRKWVRSEITSFAGIMTKDEHCIKTYRDNSDKLFLEFADTFTGENHGYEKSH